MSRAGSLVLWNAQLAEGSASSTRGRFTVIVDDGAISEVSQAGGDIPPGAVDVGGRTVLPGLIDAHLHVTSDVSRSPGFGPPSPLKGERPRARELGYFVLANVARALLRGGITTVRDVGCYDDEALVLREAVGLGLLEGPRILCCGRIVSATAPGGLLFGTMYREADGPWEMRKAVREQIQRGADFVKVMATGARSVDGEDPEPAQLTREELAAVVDEAHRMGLRVAAHAEGLGGTRAAVEAGVDTIEHGLSLHRDPALLHEMAEREIVLVPTLTTFHDLAERFAPEYLPRLVDQAKRQLDDAYRTLAAARDAGVTLAMGFDSGPPGASVAELIRMVDGGLSAREGLDAATRGSAAALGLEDVGVVEPGKMADLLVTDGDPVADIGVLADSSRIWLVLRDGRPVAGTALRADASPPPLQDWSAESQPSPCMALLASAEQR
ncbi:MAG TPA: amidohydrolase family protein [Gaiellaceae bacterium]|nr:amidohydrolase family protein [Gaiellaceae bacterium]